MDLVERGSGCKSLHLLDLREEFLGFGPFPLDTGGDGDELPLVVRRREGEQIPPLLSLFHEAEGYGEFVPARSRMEGRHNRLLEVRVEELFCAGIDLFDDLTRQVDRQGDLMHARLHGQKLAR